MALELDLYKKLSSFTLHLQLSCLPGTITAVVGPSGAGKSSLVRLIAGLDRPDRGRIVFAGRSWCDCQRDIFLPPQERQVGFVFQEYTLFPHLSIHKNITFAGASEEEADALLYRFSLSHLSHAKPRAISGGERQRVALCQAVARRPQLLLLDEPFSALDIASRQQLRHYLLELRDTLHIPIIHVTHDLEEALFLGDSLCVLERGRLAPDWLERQRALFTPPSLA